MRNVPHRLKYITTCTGSELLVCQAEVEELIEELDSWDRDLNFIVSPLLVFILFCSVFVIEDMSSKYPALATMPPYHDRLLIPFGNKIK